MKSILNGKLLDCNMNMKIQKHIVDKFTVGELYIFDEDCISCLDLNVSSLNLIHMGKLKNVLYKPVMFVGQEKINAYNDIVCKFFYDGDIYMLFYFYSKRNSYQHTVYKYSKEVIDLLKSVEKIKQ